MFEQLTHSFSTWLQGIGISPTSAGQIADISDFILVLAIGCGLYYLSKLIILKVIKRFSAHTATQWDDALLHNKVFQRMAFLVPGILIYQAIPYTLDEFPGFMAIARELINVYILIVFVLIIFSFLNAVYEQFQNTEFGKFYPIKGYIQVGKIVVFIIAALLILSYLFNQSPLYLLTGLGAFSAVLLLIFKDPILGFVGGIQLSANDMVRQGDWINMPKYGADGTVQEISLSTVKVQNFDNTITTLPTYSLVSESFQNFRGMKESGVRRIKRSVSIDMSSIVFCDQAMLEKFQKIEILRPYIERTESALSAYNAENHIDNDILVNGRRQTNIGVFRAYLEAYLHNHPMVHADSDQLVRQLQPTSNGLPIEIYAFVTVTEFISFENIQSDIFDHILAIIPQFGLRVFQSPTGEDMRKSGGD